MSGLKSRRRGYRGEYMLRDELRKAGWEANRVPSSGAAEGFKGDVVATKGTRRLVFEVKNHSSVFAKIYQLYAENLATQQDDVLAAAIPHMQHLIVMVSTSLDAVFENPEWVDLVGNHPLGKKYARTFDKLGRLQELKGEADILVLKDDRAPFLYIRYL